MKCPGQDWRYWTGEAVFEVPCPECGYAVEFFKDEPRGRCPNCGCRFLNPGIDFACARWCSMAEQCTGVPAADRPSGGENQRALAGRLIEAVREQYPAEPGRVAAALKVFRYAKWLAAREGGDPRVILAAALLWEIAASAPSRDGPAAVREVLQRLGVEEETIGKVCQVVAACQSDTSSPMQETRIVHDAVILSRVFADSSAADADVLRPLIAKLYTTAAKEAVRHAFSATEPPAGN